MSGKDVIKKFAAAAPQLPGIYRMIGDNGEVLYVGKAKNLKKRISSYANLEKLTARIQRMVLQVAKIEVATVSTEAEALLMEANLIKNLRPKYNIDLKDDKSFPYIAIDETHDFPRIFKHRGDRNKGAKYFGPYASAGDVNQTISILQRSFLLRPCSDSFFAGRTRPCLEYQIKRCSAPCVGKIDREDYLELVKEAKDFLSGKNRDVQKAMEGKMLEESARQNYEKAARYRDRIRALTQIQAKHYVSNATIGNIDVIGLYLNQNIACIQVALFRNGQALGNKAYFMRETDSMSGTEILESFLIRFYQANEPPGEIVISEEHFSAKVLEEAMYKLYSRKVKFMTPKGGEKRRLVRQACDAAKDELNRVVKEGVKQKEVLEKIAELFKLEDSPSRIEVFDNSHISGKNAIGAMIVAGPEGFIRNSYRKFNIGKKAINYQPSAVSGGDDYAMLREVLTRRYGKLKQESGVGNRVSGRENAETRNPEPGTRNPKPTWPDLVLIDGGPGHYAVAKEVFEELGISNLPFVCVAKGPDRNAGREKFYYSAHESPIQLPENDQTLFYLQRLRDEAHRFAITSHRAKRSKEISRSPLDGLEGIGPVRKKALLRHFGSASAVANASVEDIIKVQGVSRNLAQQIYDQLHGL